MSRRHRRKVKYNQIMPLLEVGDIIVFVQSIAAHDPILIQRIVKVNHEIIFWGLDVKRQITVKKALHPNDYKKYVKLHIKGQDTSLPDTETLI